MTKKLRAFFSSLILTIVLIVLICLVSVAGSLVTIKNPAMMRYLDHRVLFQGLSDLSGRPEVYWIFALIFLIFLFAINTFVCTLEKVAAIISRGAPRRSLIPQVVHVGFLIALTGHLLGSVAGFKTSGNVLFKGEPAPLAHEKGLSVRLDDFSTRENAFGQRDYLQASVTLLKDGKEVKSGGISPNHPLIYRGVAFYYNDDGMAPRGIKVLWKGSVRELALEDAPSEREANDLRITGFYPDFARDSAGRPYSQSDRFVNPYVRLTTSGEEAFLPIGQEGASVTINGGEARFTGFVVSPYVVLTINKDPGIYLVIAGSSMLLLGMVLLLVFGRGKAELIRPSRISHMAVPGEANEANP